MTPQRSPNGGRLVVMTHDNDNVRESGCPLVLVVEDEVLLRVMTVEYLESRGFAVLQAASADQAIGQLQAHRRISAIFSDIQMPGSMDGVALARWSRRERPDVKVLLTSGRGLPAGLREWPMLAKPYRMGDVERQLRDLVGAD
ncbi:MAG TPA: response regulator [Reyranella sp.]|nr:response regulator [Reyranella sp.]